jgi:hypothetical protein
MNLSRGVYSVHGTGKPSHAEAYLLQLPLAAFGM